MDELERRIAALEKVVLTLASVAEPPVIGQAIGILAAELEDLNAGLDSDGYAITVAAHELLSFGTEAKAIREGWEALEREPKPGPNLTLVKPPSDPSPGTG